MSVRLITTVTCDRCSYQAGFRRDRLAVAPDDARKWSALRGWLCENGADYCPVCAEDEAEAVR